MTFHHLIMAVQTQVTQVATGDDSRRPASSSSRTPSEHERLQREGRFLPAATKNVGPLE